jgi:hypothetical protein
VAFRIYLPRPKKTKNTKVEKEKKIGKYRLG